MSLPPPPSCGSIVNGKYYPLLNRKSNNLCLIRQCCKVKYVNGKQILSLPEWREYRHLMSSAFCGSIVK
jgi:hypothetical protein